MKWRVCKPTPMCLEQRTHQERAVHTVHETLQDESQSFVYGGSLRAECLYFTSKTGSTGSTQPAFIKFNLHGAKPLISTLVLLSLSMANITQAKKTSQSLTADREHRYTNT